MQTVWGRLLAGEIARPGSFSLRTLNVVRMLSRYDANLFTLFCSVVWRADDQWWAILPNSNFVPWFPDVGLSFGRLVNLETLGLVIRRDDRGGYGFHILKPTLELEYFGKRHVFTNRLPDLPRTEWELEIGQVMLSDVGHELVPIAGGSPNEEYRAAAVKYLAGMGWNLTEAPKQSPTPAQPGQTA